MGRGKGVLCEGGKGEGSELAAVVVGGLGWLSGWVGSTLHANSLGSRVYKLHNKNIHYCVHTYTWRGIQHLFTNTYIKLYYRGKGTHRTSRAGKAVRPKVKKISI